uniref:Uncharacterized protein n=1 Tax=Gallus gallus TaxID=9031 RepID=A0A8V0XCQ2_CHICK
MGLHTCVGTGLCKGIGMHECVQTYGECMDKCMLAQGCAEELCCTHVHTNRCCLPVMLISQADWNPPSG